MNSLGVSPYVNWMYSDLADGLIIFQLYDIIQPGVVTWPKVHKKFNRMKKFMEKLENCNYVVDLGRKQKFSLVGIAGMIPAVQYSNMSNIKNKVKLENEKKSVINFFHCMLLTELYFYTYHATSIIQVRISAMGMPPSPWPLSGS